MDKQFSTYHSLLYHLWNSFSKMNKKISPNDLEYLSKTIHQVMSARYRTYHTVNHALDLCKGSSPIEVLASAYHDTIYAQVDKRIHPLLKPFTKDFEVTVDFKLILPELLELDSMDPAREVYEIFGFRSKQELGPFTGMNEFLSAVVAGRMLFKFLSLWERLQIYAIIEATIPFRANTAEGKTVSESLFDRLKNALKNRSETISEMEITNCVKSSVKIANIDVANFSDLDVGNFVNGTWDLCLEGNPTFRNPLYLISQYRGAIQKVEGFVTKLKPEVIYRQYSDEPHDEKLQLLLETTKFNLTCQIEYLQAKLIEAAIFEAIASLSGGDCPIAQFMGELPVEGQHRVSALDSYLDPEIPKKPEKKRIGKVLQLLSGGRSKASYFDFKHSPVGTYVYERLSKQEFDDLVVLAKRYFSAEIAPLKYLRALPPLILQSILYALAEVSWVRGVEIKNIRDLQE